MKPESPAPSSTARCLIPEFPLPEHEIACTSGIPCGNFEGAQGSVIRFPAGGTVVRRSGDARAHRRLHDAASAESRRRPPGASAGPGHSVAGRPLEQKAAPMGTATRHGQGRLLPVEETIRTHGAAACWELKATADQNRHNLVNRNLKQRLPKCADGLCIDELGRSFSDVQRVERAALVSLADEAHGRVGQTWSDEEPQPCAAAVDESVDCQPDRERGHRRPRMFSQRTKL